VRLNLLDENNEPIAGKIYGKVMALESRDDGLKEADIRFTSVSQEVYQIIRQVEKSA
jgi:hypothetical protein